MTVLLTTHYMEEADLLCDRVALMHLGRIQAQGSPDELKRDLGADATLDDVFRHATGNTLAGAPGDRTRHPRDPQDAAHGGAHWLTRPSSRSHRSGASSRIAWSRSAWSSCRSCGTTARRCSRAPCSRCCGCVIFGETFNRLHAIPTGNVPYLDFLAPGMIAQSGMFVAIFYGIQIIWERDAGVLTKLLVTPTPRSALIIGKAFAAGIRSVIQVVVVLVLSALLGVDAEREPAAHPRRIRGGRARGRRSSPASR